MGRVVLVAWLILSWGVVGPNPSAAQTADTARSTLIERYEAARLRLLARKQLQQWDPPVLPLYDLPTPTDSLRPSAQSTSSSDEAEQAFPFHDVRTVRRLERDWFRKKFTDVDWSFLGASSQYTFFDTTRTPDLRARLQDQFGNPTQTLGDAPLDTSTARPQFEYWFVVNDSIPIQVTDTRGPSGRGVILSAQRRYRDWLMGLRDTLLAPLRDSERAPYVDYYYDRRRGQWYRTGFDGRSFFIDRISRTDIVPGRRPRLDSTRVSRDDPSSDEESPR